MPRGPAGRYVALMLAEDASGDAIIPTAQNYPTAPAAPALAAVAAVAAAGAGARPCASAEGLDMRGYPSVER